MDVSTIEARHYFWGLFADYRLSELEAVVSRNLSLNESFYWNLVTASWMELAT